MSTSMDRKHRFLHSAHHNNTSPGENEPSTGDHKPDMALDDSVDSPVEEETALDDSVDSPAGDIGKKASPGKSPWDNLRPYWQKYWWAVAVGGPILLLLLLPAIIAHSPVVTWMIDGAAKDLNGRLTARSASLGWFSPIVLRDVKIRDKQNETVAEISRVAGEKSLFSLLFDSSNVGRLRLEQPKLNLVLREDGSNLEEVLAKYLDPDAPSSDVDLSLEIADGAITVEEPRTRRTWEISDFQLTLLVPSGPGKPMEAKGSGALPQGRQAGKFQFSLSMGGAPDSKRTTKSGPDEAEGESSLTDHLTIKTDSLPLEVLESVVRRFVPKAEISGRMSSQLDCRWTSGNEHPRVVVKGEATGENLSLAARALGTDRPSLARLHAAGRVAWEDGRIEFDRVQTESDVGSLTLAGTLDWREASGGRVNTLLHQDYEIEGRLDLAKLAVALPATLRVRKATEITSGQVQLAMSSHQGNDANRKGMVWRGKLEASDLTAVRSGRKIVWQQPVLVTLNAHEGPQGPVIETLHCDSNFLQLRGAGTPDMMTVTAMFDLSKLANQSAGFVDFGGLRAEGEGSARLGWERKDRQAYQVTAGFSVLGLQMSLPGQPAWREERFAGELAAVLTTDFRSYRVDEAALRLETGTDFSRPNLLDLRLLQPVTQFRDEQAWPVSIRGQGQVAGWYARLAAYVGLTDCVVAGAYDLTSEVSVSPSTIGVSQARLEVANLQIDTPSLAIREPKTELTLNGRWDIAQRRVKLELASLTSGSLAIRADNFVCAPADEGATRLSGIIQCEALLDRVQPWLRPSATGRPAWNLAGKVYGRTDIDQVGSIVSAKFNGSIANLVAVHPSGQRFQENEIRLTGRGSYNDVSRSFVIDQAELVSGTLGLNGTGKVSQANNQTELLLSGKVDYDWDKIAQLLRSRYGEGIRVSGRGSGPISYRGLLGGAQAQAAGGFGWASAEVFGFQVGPGEVQAGFSQGLVDVRPLRVWVNEGQVQLVPRLRVVPAPLELTLEPGRAAENVRINPTMCAYGLQYIAPVLAGIAAAEGRFSIDLEKCRIPLAAPSKGELNGRFTVHSVQVGPGYLVQELAQVLGGATPVQLSRESVVPFQMVDGRIYHKDLELVFPDLTVRTYGSVGFDQSLAMMAEMPVPARFRTNPAVAAAFKDQVLRLPIGGTLTRPQIDRGVLQQLTQNFVRNAATNVVEDQLNKQLNRLFAPPQKPK